MLAGRLRCFSQQRGDVFVRRQAHRSELSLMQPEAEGAHRVDFEPLPHTRLVTNQPLDVGPKRVGERLREGRQKNPAGGVCPC